MDHMMPGMDGVETVAIMRKQEGGKDIPIVALTANAIAGMREMFLENGFDDFLSKPIDMHKLNRIMEKWIPLEKQEAAAEKDDADAPPNAALSELEGLNTAHGGVMADDLKNETPATADDDGDPGWRQ
jgi:CheY-like chemotaxis protein